MQTVLTTQAQGHWTDSSVYFPLSPLPSVVSLSFLDSQTSQYERLLRQTEKGVKGFLCSHEIMLEASLGNFTLYFSRMTSKAGSRGGGGYKENQAAHGTHYSLNEYSCVQRGPGVFTTTEPGKGVLLPAAGKLEKWLWNFQESLKTPHAHPAPQTN